MKRELLGEFWCFVLKNISLTFKNKKQKKPRTNERHLAAQDCFFVKMLTERLDSPTLRNEFNLSLGSDDLALICAKFLLPEVPPFLLLLLFRTRGVSWWKLTGFGAGFPEGGEGGRTRVVWPLARLKTTPVDELPFLTLLSGLAQLFQATRYEFFLITGFFLFNLFFTLGIFCSNLSGQC